MIANFFKIFAEFTLFCLLFVAKTSFGSFQWRIWQDPSQPAICGRSCNGENTTSSCGKHSLSETLGNDVVWSKGLLSELIILWITGESIDISKEMIELSCFECTQIMIVLH